MSGGTASASYHLLKGVSRGVNKQIACSGILLSRSVENERDRCARHGREYLEWHGAQGHSIHSIAKAERCVRFLCAHWANHHYHGPAEAIEAWVLYLYSSMKKSTAASYAGEIATFGRWLHAHGYADRVPHVGYKRPEAPPKAQTLERLAVFLRVLRPDMQFFVRFVLDTGLRVGAVLSLTAENFDLESGSILVTSKGDRLHKVTIGAELRPLVVDAVRKLAPGARLFPGSYCAYYNRLARASRRAGFPATISPHKLRHSFARHFCQNGGGVPDLQRILGHRTPHQSLYYARVFCDDALAAQRRLSPVDAMARMITKEVRE